MKNADHPSGLRKTDGGCLKLDSDTLALLISKSDLIGLCQDKWVRFDDLLEKWDVENLLKLSPLRNSDVFLDTADGHVLLASPQKLQVEIDHGYYGDRYKILYFFQVDISTPEVLLDHLKVHGTLNENSLVAMIESKIPNLTMPLFQNPKDLNSVERKIFEVVSRGLKSFLLDYNLRFTGVKRQEDQEDVLSKEMYPYQDWTVPYLIFREENSPRLEIKRLAEGEWRVGRANNPSTLRQYGRGKGIGGQFLNFPIGLVGRSAIPLCSIQVAHGRSFVSGGWPSMQMGEKIVVYGQGDPRQLEFGRVQRLSGFELISFCGNPGMRGYYVPAMSSSSIKINVDDLIELEKLKLISSAAMGWAIIKDFVRAKFLIERAADKIPSQEKDVHRWFEMLKKKILQMEKTELSDYSDNVFNKPVLQQLVFNPGKTEKVKIWLSHRSKSKISGINLQLDCEEMGLGFPILKFGTCSPNQVIDREIEFEPRRFGHFSINFEVSYDQDSGREVEEFVQPVEVRAKPKIKITGDTPLISVRGAPRDIEISGEDVGAVILNFEDSDEGETKIGCPNCGYIVPKMNYCEKCGECLDADLQD